MHFWIWLRCSKLILIKEVLLSFTLRASRIWNFCLFFFFFFFNMMLVSARIFLYLKEGYKYVYRCWETEKYGVFLNSFHSEVKRLIWKLERINNKIDRNAMSISFIQTRLKEKMLPTHTHTHTHTHIYIYIYINQVFCMTIWYLRHMKVKYS